MASLVRIVSDFLRNNGGERTKVERRACLGVEALEDRQMPSASMFVLVAPTPTGTAVVARTTEASVSAAVASKTAISASSTAASKFSVISSQPVKTITSIPVNADLPTVADGYLGDAGVRKVEHDAMKDGGLSRADVLAVFTQVWKDGYVSAAEFNDLHTLVGCKSVFPMTDIDRNLANKVVNGDRANTWWTGGGAAVPLGNLQANESSARLGKLVDKWFLGEDHPALPAAVADVAQEYVKVSGSLFGPGGPRLTDVYQGVANDCYFLASLGATAMRRPDIIRDMIRDNGDGTYTVRFYKNGFTPDYVTVDSYLPTRNGNLCYAREGHDSVGPTAAGNILWVALIEKAYVEWNESGCSFQNGRNEYLGIEYGFRTPNVAIHMNGGVDALAMNQITGMATTERVLPQVLWADDVLTVGSDIAKAFAFAGNPAGTIAGLLAQTTGLDRGVADALTNLTSPEKLFPVSTVRDLVNDFRAGKIIVLSLSKPQSLSGAHRLPTSAVAATHCVVLANVSADGTIFEIYNQATGQFYLINREQLLDTFALYSRPV